MGDLTTTLHSVAHTSIVQECSFGMNGVDVVCTGSDSGELFIWDLSDYSHRQSTRIRSPILTLCVSEHEDEILCGCQDGTIRAFRLSRRANNTSPIWEIAAHRGKITALREMTQYIVSGGEDLHCRVWHRRTHELLTHFCVHRKPITDIQLDIDQPNIFHSGSEDRFVVTYDLKMNKPVVQHNSANSNITGLSQRKDCEKEVLTCGLDGRILFWDVDVADPVGCFHEQDVKFCCLAVSPDGRYVAAGSEDSFVFVFDLGRACKIQEESGGHSGRINSIAWSPDQKQIITTSEDTSVAVWNFFELNPPN